MRCLSAVLILWSSAGLAEDKPSDDLMKKELAKLQGTWQAVVQKKNGSKVPIPPPELLALSQDRIEGNREIVIFEGAELKEVKKTFRIDPTKEPKQMETLVEYRGKKELQRHIYKIDGDTLVIASCEDDTILPKSFDQDGVSIAIMKRVKK